MPKVSQFRESVYTVRLDYGLGEPVILDVRPFTDVTRQLEEIENITEDDAGKLKAYSFICTHLAGWQNVRDDIPASVASLDEAPTAYRNLYKEVPALNGSTDSTNEGYRFSGEQPQARFYLDGNPDAVPREVDIPLDPQALLEFKFDFRLGVDFLRRAMAEVDTKKRRGGRN